MRQYDVLIIGAGVIGCMIARWLSRYELRILLIEREADVGMGASSANSAIVHAGYDPPPGTLKAITNVRGNAMWDDLAGELNIPFDRRGDYVVAVGAEELPALEQLMEQGRRNGVPGMSLISGAEMLRREPNLNPLTSGALWAASGGLCDPFAVTIAAAENAVQNGVTLLTETAFEAFVPGGIQTNRGVFGCRWVINAAGLNADAVMHHAGVRPEFRITPRRGEYAVLDRAEITIRNVLFPVPSAKGKGILVTATVHGNAIVGPNAQDIDDKEDRATTAEGLDEIWRGAHKLIPALNPRHTIATFAGLRACGNARCQTTGVNYDHDFVIEIPKPGFINLGGIDSPGLTAAPAIAERVVDLLKDAGLELKPRRDWNPIRPAPPRFCNLSTAQKAELIRRDPRYGRVVCRCEMVTEGEIVAAIHSPVPARTYDALKRRTWLGTGRCLGAFDMPRVVDILARELGIPPTQVTKKGPGSEFLVRETKSWDEANTDSHSVGAYEAKV
ncbi:MAG: NAD(P)/FAD-dependent oxidoreductase [Anaerolineae bacterium]|nr:NAD(P)/FAD-dependent oxidoreductase [Thermoflexales bacterium]MDW8407719.1 NAD(P)/FAD-dependent oxidoreductase [Anaerolineae bacterium]